MTSRDLVGQTSAPQLTVLLQAGDDAFLKKLLASPRPAGALLAASEKVHSISQIQSQKLLAHAAFVQRKFSYVDAALKTLNKVDSLSSMDMLVWAKANRVLGQPKLALKILSLSPVAENDDVDWLIERAVNLLLAGRLKQALKEVRRASRVFDETLTSTTYRTVDWMLAYLEAALDQPVSSDAFSQKALTKRYENRSAARDAQVVFAVLDYKTPDLIKSSMNIGDYIQTVALLRHVARRVPPLLTFDDPELAAPFDQLRKTWSKRSLIETKKSVHVSLLDRDAPWAIADVHENQQIWTVLHGWFFHQAFGSGSPFPLPDNVHPIIMSFYLQRPEDLSETALAYLRKHTPIGCRDWSTVYWLLNQGIDAFFSGCVTLTLQMKKPKERFGEFCVDTGEEHTDPTAKFVGQNEPQYRNLRFSAAITKSMELLSGYAGAARVKTSRLHCYLPCLALGTPVKFVPKTFADRRFDGLDHMDKSGGAFVRKRVTNLLDAVMEPIFAGKAESTIRKAWLEVTAPFVNEARRKLVRGSNLFAMKGSQIEAGGSTNVASQRKSKTKRPSKVTVALAFDENLTEKAMVTIRSILANTASKIEFVVLTRGVSKEQIDRMKEAFPESGFIAIAMDEKLAGADIRLMGKITISTMDRLFLPDLLPNRDKVVYLDVDVAVLGDIAELASTTTSSRGIAACPTPNPNHYLQVHWIERAIALHQYDTKTAREYRRMTAAQVNLLAPYFNAGVLVLSLKKLRELDLTKQALGLIERYGLDDQEILNLFSLGDYQHLPSRWNSQPYSHWFEDAGIIHWPGAMKPWLHKRPIQHANRWLEYAHKEALSHKPAEKFAKAIVPPAKPTKMPKKISGSNDWGSVDSYEPSWDKRAEMAARWLPKTGRIADIGCGAPMSLKQFLGPKVDYQPADLKAWNPEVTVVDLNKKEFPVGTFDAIALLGVLEYLEQPSIALRFARKASNLLVVSYCHPRGANSDELRLKRGWINGFQEAGLERLLLRLGWKIEAKELYSESASMRQFVYLCEACEPVLPPQLGPLSTKVRAEKLTYLRPEKMARLEDCLARVQRENVKGEFVEFGVALGGSAIVIADAAVKERRRFSGFDVFEMIPEPSAKQDDEHSRDRYKTIADGKSKGIGGDIYYGYRNDLYGDVVSAFERYALPVDGKRVALERGLFEQTWPKHAHKKIAFAHIDCDWYEPVQYCLAAMERSLVKGGIILLDDYHDYSGARIAVDEFVKKHQHFVMEDGPNPILTRTR